MTSGAGQPSTDQTFTFTAFIDPKSAALSLAASVLGLASDVPRIFGGQPVDPRGGLLAAALVTAQCSDKVPASFTDVGQSYEFFRCVIGAAVANLENPDKALAAAIEQFGEASYGAEAEEALKTRATVLKVMGAVVKVLSLGGAVRDIWSQVVDAYAQMGSVRTGDVHLHLRGGQGSGTGAPESESGEGCESDARAVAVCRVTVAALTGDTSGLGEGERAVVEQLPDLPETAWRFDSCEVVGDISSECWVAFDGPPGALHGNGLGLGVQPVNGTYDAITGQYLVPEGEEVEYEVVSFVEYTG